MEAALGHLNNHLGGSGPGENMSVKRKAISALWWGCPSFAHTADLPVCRDFPVCRERIYQRSAVEQWELLLFFVKPSTGKGFSGTCEKRALLCRMRYLAAESRIFENKRLTSWAA
jgi:hypothetical protein